MLTKHYQKSISKISQLAHIDQGIRVHAYFISNPQHQNRRVLNRNLSKLHTLKRKLPPASSFKCFAFTALKFLLDKLDYTFKNITGQVLLANIINSKNLLLAIKCNKSPELNKKWENYKPF